MEEWVPGSEEGVEEAIVGEGKGGHCHSDFVLFCPYVTWFSTPTFMVRVT